MRILNYGSLNIDYTYRLEHIVVPGETISSGNMEIYPGGKGLNQSIALAKAGAEVYHAGLIGKDGEFLKDLCEKNGVNTSYIRYSEERTGNAIIQVAETGENSIILFPGANFRQSKKEIDETLKHFGVRDILLLQNEINELEYIIERGKERGMMIALNPSPFNEQVKRCDLSLVDLFLMNEIEGEQITGLSKPEDILGKMEQLYPEAKVLLTLGKKGSAYCDKGKVNWEKAEIVQAVDTTAAGDTYTGYFLAALSKEKEVSYAMKYASVASGIAVTKKGASTSIPGYKEVEEKMERE